MNSPKPELPEINEEDRTPLVDVLLELLAWQQRQIDKLKQDILKLTFQKVHGLKGTRIESFKTLPFKLIISVIV